VPDELTLGEYGRVRERERRFVVLSRHERLEIEHVVERLGSGGDRREAGRGGRRRCASAPLGQRRKR
jgi:hypothetical protein